MKTNPSAVQPVKRIQKFDRHVKGEPNTFDEILKREREKRYAFTIPSYPIPGEKQ